MKQSFDPALFYKDYPQKVILRPGYPARAQYKSTLMWDLYGKRLNSLAGSIHSYADIGGCFGFGANAMAFHISQSGQSRPETHVFEIDEGFTSLGKQLFPHINFISKPFESWSGEPFDLVSLFDVIEHIPDAHAFLSGAARRCRYALIMTPMETKGEFRQNKRPDQFGASHPDGHINFFFPAQYKRLLAGCGFEIIREKLVYSIIPRSAERILSPEELQPVTRWGSVRQRASAYIRNPHIIPFFLTRRIFGYGKHLCLVKSRFY